MSPATVQEYIERLKKLPQVLCICQQKVNARTVIQHCSSPPVIDLWRTAANYQTSKDTAIRCEHLQRVYRRVYKHEGVIYEFTGIL